ncbi:MAG: hypothetical protein BRD23_07210 [Halobacteriales archaeon SW_9_67_25]|nr:MAG: hypothetical protein BRD23_07210 [Halobacteriales archaeon SW_9_67_25]
MAAVGGLQFGEYRTGSSLTFRSVVTLGSFERTALEERIRAEGNPETERDYGGATVFGGVDGREADVTLVGLYEDAASAEATIENVEATYDGDAVVVTVTGETRSLLDGTAVTPPTAPG